MERLEPVLKQKFWILLGVAILMTFVGWWMATGNMAQAITTRQKSIQDSFSSVNVGDVPNESWAKRLSIINDSQDQSIKLTKLELWKRQEAKMTWPQDVVPINGYWGKFATNPSRELYRTSWIGEVERVWRLVNPMEEDGSGIVYFPLANMGRVLKKGREPWKQAPPDSEVMWETREDLWLLEGLFQSIASINGGPTATRTDAVIHQIDKLEFRGGGPKSSLGGALASSDSGVGGAGMAAMMMMGPGAGGRDYATGGMGPGGMGGVLSAGLTPVTAEFDPTEEFGDDGSASGGGFGSAAGMGNMGMLLGANGDGASSATPAAKPANRYLQIDEKLPYKQRGFYLSVKMDHRKIPLLIAELTSNEKSVWPVEILRVQMARLNEDDSPQSSSPSGASGLGGMSGAMASMMKANSGPGVSGLGALGGAAGLAGGAGMLGAGDEEFGLSSNGTAVGEFGATERALNAKAFLENALRDPVMAQVTICGTFTLYKKVDEVVVPQPPSGQSVPDAPVATETSPDGTPTTADGTDTKKPEEATEAMEAEGEVKATTESTDNVPDAPPATPPNEKPDPANDKNETDKNETEQK